MDIQHGIVKKIYPTDCAYDKAIVEDRIMIIGSGAVKELDVKEVVLPESVIELGSYAFFNCEKLETITLPSGVKKIGERCFSGCKSLKKIIIPEGVTTIEAGTFNECENIEEIVLPESLKEIKYRAFADCKKLKKITIPKSVTAMDWGVFAGCESLESIVIPESVSAFGYQMFLNCKKLKDVILPSSMTILPDETFMGCTSLGHIALPKNIIQIGKSAFNGCKILKDFPENVYIFGESAFKNCRGLTDMTINSKVESLPNGMFEGCVKLKNISCTNKSVSIGERTFRSCISLKSVPDFVKAYNKYAFENCLSLTEVSNLDGIIPDGTFRGCKNIKKVNDSTSVSTLGAGAFSGCKSLETFECSKNLTMIQDRTFEHCENLRLIIFSNGITRIGDSAFLGCIKLSDVNLPPLLKILGNYALKHCDSVKCIYVPKHLENIGIGALSYMMSLEKIEVSPKNNKYLAFDNIVLMDAQYEQLVQYAIGSKNKTYSILPFTWQVEALGDRELIRQVRGITEYAFAGSQYLEDLILDSSVRYLERTAFENTSKLKTLYIKKLPLFSSQGFTVTNNKQNDYEHGDFPFENVYLEDGITMLEIDGFSGFRKLKKAELPNDLIIIKQQVFKNCKDLAEIFVPSSVCNIFEDAFSKSILLKFENGVEISGDNFLGLNQKNDTKIYKLKKKYLVERDGWIVPISISEIEASCLNSSLIKESPAEVVNYIALLSLMGKDYKFLRNGIYIKAFSDQITSAIFSKLQDKQEDAKSTTIFKSADDMFESFSNIRKFSTSDKNFNNLETNDAVLFIKYFDANMKRMIELSGILKNKDTATDNFKDLLKLAKVLGAFESDPIIRQRAITFISDRIFTKVSENKGSNYTIVGDDIHRKFEELKPRAVFDYEFAKFFIENYKKLCDKESLHSGFISRAYSNFVEISKTSTSDKGLQRHLLVTFEKCCHYLASHKFDGVTKETEQLAIFLGDWFDKSDAFQNGVTITTESQTAPRNIFTKFEIQKDDKMVFDNSASHDLKEPASDNFSFEWLHKQSWANLLLGKYCNCCAHINGAGAGIMRASMITPDHQNLVIRNNLNEIIGKSTIYVNRKEQYAVFNNIESSSKYTTDKDKEKIYNAFMRGAKSFLEKYNENNPDCPILVMTIGTSRNTINIIFEAKEKTHPTYHILQTPKYGDWSLNGYGNYTGDSGTQQRLVLKKNLK